MKAAAADIAISRWPIRVAGLVFHFSGWVITGRRRAHHASKKRESLLRSRRRRVAGWMAHSAGLNIRIGPLPSRLISFPRGTTQPPLVGLHEVSAMWSR